LISDDAAVSLGTQAMLPYLLAVGYSMLSAKF